MGVENSFFFGGRPCGGIIYVSGFVGIWSRENNKN
jgi:hypothetical protein